VKKIEPDIIENQKLMAFKCGYWGRFCRDAGKLDLQKKTKIALTISSAYF